MWCTRTVVIPTEFTHSFPVWRRAFEFNVSVQYEICALKYAPSTVPTGSVKCTLQFVHDTIYVDILV